MNYLECLLEGPPNKQGFIFSRSFYNFFTNPPFAQTKKGKDIQN